VRAHLQDLEVLMKALLMLRLFLSLHVAFGGKQQFQSLLGCFKDDKKRDFALWKKTSTKTLEECRKFAKDKGKKYFAMQWGDQCFADDTFGTPRDKYYQIPVSKCVRGNYKCGNSEHRAYCGGAWANAVFLTKPVLPISATGVALRLTSPYKQNFCLVAYTGNYKKYDIGWNYCTYKEKTKWIMKGTQFMTTTPSLKGYCMDMNNKNKNLYMHKCHNGKNQKWYWADGASLKNKASKECADWDYNKNGFYMHKCHSGQNQKFWWNLGQTMEIDKGVSGNRKYLSTTWRGDKVDLWTKDDGSGRQTWEMVKAGTDWYNIRVTNGVKGTRKGSGEAFRLENGYLSCNSDGTKVDVWPKDDASGRQRWKLKKVKGGGFNILVYGGVKGKRKFLSTTQKGDKVDLWIKDDKSGRQVWRVHGSFVPTPKPTPVPTPRPTPVPVRNLVSAGGWKVTKGYPKCTLSIENGAQFPCAVSPNYPNPYSRDVACEFSLGNTKRVSLHGSTEKWFDYLTIQGKQYSGKLQGMVAAGATAKWTADFFEDTKGWKICKAKPPQMRVNPKKKKGNPKNKKGKKPKGRK